MTTTYQATEITSGSAVGKRYVQVVTDGQLGDLLDADGDTIIVGNYTSRALGRERHDFEAASGDAELTRKGESPAAALGRRRMAKLTPEQRSALARKAALARWPKPPTRVGGAPR